MVTHDITTTTTKIKTPSTATATRTIRKCLKILLFFLLTADVVDVVDVAAAKFGSNTTFIFFLGNIFSLSD